MQELRGFPVNIIVKTENIQGEPAHGYFIGLLEHIANITHSFHGAGRRAPSYGGGETPGRHHGRNLRGEALGSDAGGILVGVVLLPRRGSQAQLQGTHALVDRIQASHRLGGQPVSSDCGDNLRFGS